MCVARNDLKRRALQVRIDVGGQLVPGSHRISVPSRASAAPRTLAHDELGPSNVLRLILPDDEQMRGGGDPHAERSKLHELCDAMVKGLTVCGRKFEFLAIKTDHNVRDIKVYFVATVAPTAHPLLTRCEPSRPWRTAAEARALFAAFEETLPNVGKASVHMHVAWPPRVRCVMSNA